MTKAQPFREGPDGDGEGQQMAARIGSAKGGRKVRLGKRVTGTAAAFAALAALTGSQVSGLGLAQVAAADAGPAQDGTAAQTQGSSATPFGGPAAGVPGTAADGGSAVQLPQPPGTQPGLPAAGPFTANGPSLPATVFAAYQKAEASLAQRSPGCHLPWQLLAAIGQVESGQANGGKVDSAGTTLTPILGPVLDGNGFAAIPDTDGGRYDGDSRWDRAVGPMQFIPSTWAAWGVDATGKGTADPNNIFDAAETAGRYLCAGGRDLSDPSQLDRAILSYNNSTEYLRTVRNWMAHYGSGQVTTVADRPGGPAVPGTSPSPFLQPSGGGTGTTGNSGTTGTTPTGDGGTGTGPTPSTQPTVPPVTPTPTPSATPTDAATPTGSPSPSASPTATPTGTPTTPTTTPSGSASPTATPSGTPSGTPTGTPTSCPSPTATATPTTTPSGSASPTATPTGTPTATPTAAPNCPTPTPSGSPSATATPAAGSSTAPSGTPSSSLSPSPSVPVKQ
ncbi:lytic murein transglycosylase [Kitasatospora sp. NPDC058162]|uniref:lytic murein transglycosylase n=1 Tax=Kitasatospora sp. NPDC058162 TaxID=3346362 RepID=UPI0036DAEFF9